jgi:hypothetical protein
VPDTPKFAQIRFENVTSGNPDAAPWRPFRKTAFFSVSESRRKKSQVMAARQQGPISQNFISAEKLFKFWTLFQP